MQDQAHLGKGWPVIVVPDTGPFVVIVDQPLDDTAEQVLSRCERQWLSEDPIDEAASLISNR